MRLFNLFRRRAADPSPGYRVYTRDYDQEVDAKDLDRVLGVLSEADKVAARESWDLFGQGLQAWRTRTDLAALEAAQRVRKVAADLSETAITILIDHSGSMRGQRMLLAAAATDISYDFLAQLGCAVEVLGFTTSSWRGGRSRERWQWQGRPKGPGRLCDLLHIVYRRPNDSVAASLVPMLRLDLLKENVDGEALLWAASRLREATRPRKILLVVSDGAPVDDSTLLANDPGYLDRHLREVIAEFQGGREIELAALGIGYDVGRYYARSAAVRTPEDLGVAMIDLLERLLSREPLISPNVSD